MKVFRTPAEVEQITTLLRSKPTFYKCFSKDWTDIVLDDLHYKLYGKIPRNFLVNIGGLIGNETGIFKSTMGLQLALYLDPMFNLQKRVAFSINDLLDKVKENTEYELCNSCYYNFTKTFKGTYEAKPVKIPSVCKLCGKEQTTTLVLLTKLIFFLDEQTRTLKLGGMTRLQNLVDTCRQRQICFITCGVEQYDMTFNTYSFHRLQESSDDYLPKKRVRYGVYDNKRDIYYGYFVWDITPLTDYDWNAFWKEYSEMKTEFQRIAISQQIQSMNYEDYAQEVMELEDFVKCFKYTKDGRQIMQSQLVMALITKKYPDLTEREKNLILSEIKFMSYDEEN